MPSKCDRMLRSSELVLSIYWLYERTGEAWLLNLVKRVQEQSFDWRSHYEDFQYEGEARTVEIRESRCEQCHVYQTAWIRIALLLFTFSGVIWVAALIPIQNRLARWADTPGSLPVSFFTALHWWYFWGLVATLLPLVSMVLMVVKPG